MTVDGDEPFSLVGPLPWGKVAIQASAGTGKTFALAALATRYIVEEDISASELLIVTFTRAATNDLRARVRDRLVAAADHLADRWAGPTGDELLDHLAGHRSPVHLERLQRAVTEFDAATVTTIHGFAKQVLGALGVSAGTDPDARLDVDSSDMIEETCADVLVGAAVDGSPVDCLPSLDQLRRATQLVSGRPGLDLVPTRGQPGATEAQQILTELVERSVRAIGERRRQSGTLSFDDVLTQLRDVLCHAGPGADSAIESLRNRFKVVLIDEFQDTDPVQWDIFSTLFDRPTTGIGSALVLVGDPKQAIYGFRGADIHTYLKAVGDGSRTERASLATNWRSDGAVLTSLGAVLEGATFGDADIHFVPVKPAPANRDRRLTDAGGGPLPALALRVAIGEGIDRHKNKDHLVKMGSAERAIWADLVGRIADLLQRGRVPDGTGADGRRPVRPPDIAVLVGRHTEAASVQSALLAAAIPAVVSRGGSVLQSPAAGQMRWLLEALVRPSDPRRARMFALSWFVGRSVGDVAAMSDADLVALQEQLRLWSERLGLHSVADVFAQIWAESGVVERVLRSPEGDRDMTDLDHLAELFQGAGPSGRSGPAALLAVLDAEPEDESDSEVEGDVAARRIASEADAVQIMTVWAAKGLEFPIVCLPTLWHAPGAPDPIVYVDRRTGRRTFDLARGNDWPDQAGCAERISLAVAEAAGERLRLLYVALTRARHQTVVWWANADRSSTTALARVLFARTDGKIDPDLYAGSEVPIPADRRVLDALRPLVDAAAGTLEVEAIDADADLVRTAGEAASGHAPPELTLATVGPPPVRSTHRWSFSAIVHRADADRAAGDGAAGGRFDPADASMSDRGAGDEGASWEIGPIVTVAEWEERPTDPGPDGPVGGDEPPGSFSALADLPAGATFGTLVHSVLEAVDFAAPDLAAQLDAAIGRQLEWRSLDLTPSGSTARTAGEGRALLVAGLRAAVETPLGPVCNGVRLADIGPADRITEMSFDLRLANDGPMASVRDIGRLMLTHLEPTDALRPWAVRLAAGALDVSLGGHLTGSIDLIMRVGDQSTNPRFVVADYKTNALHRRGSVARPEDYGPARMVEAMADHDYPLQAMLYSVALHRYLRWRLPGYRPEIHLGGAAYLFLRGMAGPAEAMTASGPTGVHEWAIPPDLVTGLSDLLDGRAVPEDRS
jgi:exodeoxyribonuclease V beta subunit